MKMVPKVNANIPYIVVPSIQWTSLHTDIAIGKPKHRVLIYLKYSTNM